MHWCDSSHNNNMVGPGSYTYGVYHHGQSSPLSVHFSDPYTYSNPYSSPSSSVDCTLSLGTPSTRLTEDTNKGSTRHERHSSISNFSWNGIGTAEHELPSSGAQSNKVSRRSGGDPLFARRCANCDTASTPLWRNGPRGPKSLCNACGIRFKKEERRATAAAAASVGSIDSQPTIFGHNQYGSWAAATASQGYPQKVPSCFGCTEFRFNEDEARDHPDSGMSFLSWSLNFTDRASGFIHDFTR